LDSFEQAKILGNPVDVDAVCDRLLNELENFLQDNSLEDSLEFVKRFLVNNDCQSLQSELAISTRVSKMIDTWEAKHGCALLRALVVFTSAVPNGVSESSVRTATRYVAENAKLGHSREDLHMVAEAIAQFLRVHTRAFKTRRLQDLLYLEAKDTFFIALEVASLLLGENKKSLNWMPLCEVVDALFSREDFDRLSGEERIRVAKKLAYAMPIEYWAESLSGLESRPSDEFGKWTPREHFIRILLLGEEPVLGAFHMHNEDRTILAFTKNIKDELEKGRSFMDVISSVGARLEETSDQEYTLYPNPIQNLITEAISNSSKWRNRQAVGQTVVNLDDYRPNDEGDDT
jgi:hypothetical protein